MSNSFVENIKKLSDDELIERINSGSYEILQILVSRYTPIIRGIALKLASNESDVEDLIQDGLIAFCSAVKAYCPEQASFSSFATLVCKRAMIDQNRLKSRKRRIPDELVSSLEDNNDIVGDKSAEAVFIEQESLRDLTDTIRLELSAFEYKVLLSFISGKTYSSIAEENGVSVKSVDNALKRIRTKLKNRN